MGGTGPEVSTGHPVDCTTFAGRAPRIVTLRELFGVARARERRGAGHLKKGMFCND